MTTDTAQGEWVGQVAENLQDLIVRAECVLFDFDGPICRLYAHHDSRTVVDNLVEWLARQGEDGLLTADERDSADPRAVLSAVHAARPGSPLEAALEARLTEEELCAAARAFPTPYVDRLIRTWHATGVRLAVATDHAPEAARRYIEGRGVADCFGPHIHGRRTGRVHSLKPDPDCLHRALDSLGADPSTTLLIGDAPADHLAAREAGVAFLGYGQDGSRQESLRSAGVRHVVDSLGTVLRTVWAGALL
ncbi:HAD family hydrolase [Streptomyces cavernicola]|uniref:HAD-IA family hydrolase n=1 Tax=Streptomyces cavernicola TaxID=3043613 RepID=A0ABT6SHR3_9ACTN|nr:HAD-IA family hydrolase [Streptomyces sp. B-S-A6]MDI3407404.1 HAD-IA family hydrolase [Streptomyces sp. B-S-A6]